MTNEVDTQEGRRLLEKGSLAVAINLGCDCQVNNKPAWDLIVWMLNNITVLLDKADERDALQAEINRPLNVELTSGG